VRRLSQSILQSQLECNLRLWFNSPVGISPVGSPRNELGMLLAADRSVFVWRSFPTGPGFRRKPVPKENLSP
jgi:hypothetical protein